MLAFVIVAMIAVALGMFAGHGVGYARGIRAASPRRSRVGRPE